MISDERKYRSEMAKIAGIAFMTPVGRVFLDPFTFLKQNDHIFAIVFFLYSLSIAAIGFALLFKAHDILNERIDK